MFVNCNRIAHNKHTNRGNSKRNNTKICKLNHMNEQFFARNTHFIASRLWVDLEIDTDRH